MRIVELKVKVKALAAEARIIRHEEQKRKGYLARHRTEDTKLKQEIREEWLSLKGHRRFIVREEARAAYLAYGFLRGTAYLRIEAKCHEPPNWIKVESIVKRFGAGRNDLDLNAWRDATAPGVKK